MPTLDLGDFKNGLDNWAGIRVLASMVYPDDKVRREYYLAWLKTEDFINHCEMVERKSGQKNLNFILDNTKDLKAVMKAPSHNDVMKHANQFIEQAALAGEMLFAIGKFANATELENIGVNQAAYLLQEGLKRGKSKSQRQVKERTLQTYWSYYKPVAHLWCAMKLLRRQFGVRGYPDCNLFKDKANLIPILAVANQVKLFGETFRWHINQEPLLSKNSCLIPPKAFHIPRGKINWPPVSSWEAKVVSKNRS